MDTSLVSREVSRLVQRARGGAEKPERSAADLAWHRVAFFAHALLWLGVVLLLMVTAGFYPALVVALSWGILLSAHGFFAVLAPRLGRKWTAEEMDRRAITDQANAGERQLARGRQARSLEQLSASIAHEIRNPITAAKSLLQQMAEDPASPANVEYARVALEELDRVERSVSHLLRYAREEELTLLEIDLADVAEAALAGMETRVSASRARVERDFDFEARLPLRGDADKLRRVVMNLVDNALDVLETSAKTDPCVRVSCGRSLGGSEVWLRVKDNGPGIEAARLAQIWSPFHTSKEHGTGLGLAITKKLVEAHAGTIEVSSDGAAGTEFVATFPESRRAHVKPRILLVEDERAIRIALKGLLEKRGYEVLIATSGEEAITLIASEHVDLVLSDLALGGSKSGMDVLAATQDARPGVPVVLITAHGNEKVAVQAMKAGAADYVPKPFDNDELRMIVERALSRTRLERDHQALLERVQREQGLGALIGTGPAMRKIFETIQKVAPTDLTVLVRGESGTGKELVAQALHDRSPRARRPFVAVNCAAMSRELVESELFGHERGAFTGADARRIGRFEAAAGGTLFLDEIGDMPLATQAKVLRVLQEQAFERVGGNVTVRTDARVVAATHRDLETDVKQSRFREDLYYRLRVVELALPPLRERAEDVPALAMRLLSDLAVRLGRPAVSLAPEALAGLAAHPFPGNVRELRNVLEKAAVLASGSVLGEADLDLGARSRRSQHATSGVELEELPFADAKRRAIADFERGYLGAALARNGGNVSRTAEAIGMVRQSLQQKMRELGLRGDAKGED